MSHPPTAVLRRHRVVFKTIAAVVAVAFLSLETIGI